MRLPFGSRRAGDSSFPGSRRSSPITLVRIAAAAAMLASSAGLYALTTSPEFELGDGRVVVKGARQAAPEVIREALALPEGVRPNLFRLRTEQLESAVESLPAVLHASVRVALPDELLVQVQERQPILVWHTRDRAFLVDVEGVLFADGARPPGPLPEAIDRRAASDERRLGDRLDALDLEVVRTLGALTPATVDSTARSFALSVDDALGWTVEALPGGWKAVFGHYTPQLRTPELIGEQVRCLAALLGGHEGEVQRVYLAPKEERCGSFLPAPSASPADSAPGSGRPGRSPKPRRSP